MMKVFVTGATGLLGKAIVEKLVKDGYETKSLVHATAIDKNDPMSKTEIVWGNLLNESDHEDYLKTCDAVVHCAWNFSRSNDIKEYEKTNIKPALSLMRAAKQLDINKFITISSVSVYGLEPADNGKAFDENSEFCSYDDAMDVYPRAKQKCEIEMSKLAKEIGMELVIIRPGLLYSDEVPPVKKSIKGKVSLFAGFGQNHLPYIHVDSVANLVEKVLEDKSENDVEIYNAVPAHSDTARAVYKRWKSENVSSAKAIYLPSYGFKMLALAPYFIKKALKKNASRPNAEYQTKTGTRNVQYSAEKAEKKYNWLGY
ncbi:MAG: NAD(P)-dependent oxidoreductase [Acidimicrobiia bacterium]